MKRKVKENNQHEMSFMESTSVAYHVTFFMGMAMYFAISFIDETKLYLVESLKIASMMGFGVYFLLYGFKERKKPFVIVGVLQIIMQILRLIYFFTDYII